MRVQKRNAAKEKRLMKQEADVDSKLKTLERRMLELFNAIVVNRYKDCHAELRADTIAGLGTTTSVTCVRVSRSHTLSPPQASGCEGTRLCS